MVVYFQFLRPKSHYGKRGKRTNAPTWHTTRPDGTKLWRSTEDALKGIAWKDDSQVVWQLVEKLYADRSGAQIYIMELNEMRDLPAFVDDPEVSEVA